MSISKEERLKAILNVRNRLNHIPLGINREIDIFEEQMNKALRRIDKMSYLAKKFSGVELAEILEAYNRLINPS